MTETDSKTIARRWNREIEDELRREAALQAERGPWRRVVWGVLWLSWLVLVLGIVAHVKS